MFNSVLHFTGNCGTQARREIYTFIFCNIPLQVTTDRICHPKKRKFEMGRKMGLFREKFSP